MAGRGNLSDLLKQHVEFSLSKKIGYNVQVSSSQMLGGGCINNALKLHTNAGVFFMKWNAHSTFDIFTKEAESLMELKNATTNNLLVPEVFCSKEIDLAPGFLILEFLEPGNSCSENEIRLGRGLAMIHKQSNDRFGFYSDNYCGATVQNNSWKNSWIDFFRENRLNFLLKLISGEGSLTTGEYKIYQKLMDKLERLLPDSSTPSLIHGDLWSGNYMFSKDGPALIDPASYYADREMEFAIITMFGGFSSRFFSAYNEVFPLDNDWKERNSLYQLYHILNHYYLFGGSYGDQAIQVAKSFL